ncbi:FAD/NAD(P)-binding domain-containing protein [Choiromyces venosus 120613-1]|uniref:FAD/NAD(P)-binding domain-containing protein n=1 Tax=Choiromyces venosus 120613-1 TaxID=1336337 RepID=A0A3N4JNX3_9PEZI|nr:FAD/NAD(P)-binding domain-containing protein [Choiromyces venosus 120613-1]
MAPPKALIIGAGITGPAAALLLHSLGIQVTIYELRPSPSTLGGAISLAPNSLRILDKLGVYEKLKTLGCSVPTMQMFSASTGKVLGSLSFGDKSRHGYESLRVPRRELQNVLLERAVELGVRVVFGKKLVEVIEREDGVTAKFEDGGEGEEVTGDLLLGCDGIHSVVRSRLVQTDRVPLYTGVAASYGIVKKAGLTAPIPFDRTGFFNGRCGSIIASYCDAAMTEVYWAAVMQVQKQESRDGWRAVGEDREAVKKDVLKRFEGSAVGCIKELIEESEDVYLYPVWKLEGGGNWHSKRCVLLGDAAHAMPPHGGSQGFSLALEDAVILSRVLEKEGLEDLEKVFVRFEEVRKPRVNKIYLQANKNWENIKDIGWFANMVKEFFMWIYLIFFAKSVEESYLYDAHKVEI